FFQQSTGVSAPGGGGVVSIGGCILTQTITGGSIGTTTGLNAGTITVTGPGGSPVTMTGIHKLPGFYTGTLATIPSTGGAFVFNGTAGTQVGAFTATVTFPNPLLAWTNQSAAATVGRSQGLTVSWTGGAPGTYVVITGSSVSGTASGSYACYAPQSAGSFTVPSYVLLGLPSGTGSTTVQNSTSLGSFTATGLDFGLTLGTDSFMVNSTYN
ncbi:MAG: repeat containing protein, partial [Bryobacterales bacterium]|nr:repeat containing protein [Bryobacterales bacterium]